ncbi:MAG: MerR family transcriptional regulator [Hyphomonadaceae bacterium]|nr:MerR family transcriptional regulator [Hyphomonadaceae bacterium]
MNSAAKAEMPFESDSVRPIDEAKSADAFRTIGEAAQELGLKTHVLRFWETKFDNLRPMKRPDGRRFYRPEDMEVLRKLQNLLHVQGLTIRGALKAIDSDLAGEPGAASVSDENGAEEMPLAGDTGASVRDLQDAVRDAVERGDFREPEVRENNVAKERLESLLSDLTNLKSRLDAVRTAA